jgi:hypothetical protein
MYRQTVTGPGKALQAPASHVNWRLRKTTVVDLCSTPSL